MTMTEFEATYPNEYNKLRRACKQLFDEGGWSILGSYSYSDLADWLSCTTGVKYKIAREFVDLYV